MATKKTYLTLIIALFILPFIANSQNIQFHHDFGRNLYSSEEGDRMLSTLTVEFFKPDKFGSTFFFADFDICHTGVKGAYTELSREISFGYKKQFAGHIEYNGGLATDKYASYSALFQPAVLIGPAWNWTNADFSKTFSFQLMYKRYFKGTSRKAFNSAQATAVWGVNFGQNRRFTCSGYADLWINPDVDGNLVFMTEPQFWYNLNSYPALKDIHLSLGTEWELSNNFILNFASGKTFFVNPTVAVKWSF